MIKKMILSVVLLLFVSLLVAGCADHDVKKIDIQSPNDVVCDAGNINDRIYDGCNWCTCEDFDGNYGWSCTERYCGEDTPSY